MRHSSAFDRDFRDLHGYPPPRAPVIEHSDVRGRRLRARVDRPILRLAFGLAGLIWTIIIGGALIAAIIVAAVFAYAFFTT